jgi:Peptidase M30
MMIVRGVLMAAFLVSFIQPLAAQVRRQVPLQEEGITGRGSYPVHGSSVFWKEDQKFRAYLAAHPEAVRPLRKTTAWNFVVGSTKQWWAPDATNGTRYLTASTCRAVGTRCYIFVEDAVWGSRVTQAAVDSIVAAFDLRTPANSQKGIYDLDVAAFGNIPDVDNDPRVIILILDIRDGYTGSGGFVVGYFSAMNELAMAESNQAEFYYLDANPLDLTAAWGLQEGISTTAHEFQHMIHFNYDPYEMVFVNEMCSLVAEVNCGFPIYYPNGYVTETNHYLFDWRSLSDPNVGLDYSRAARFGTYLRDQFGIGVFKPIVASPLHGISGLDAGLAATGSTTRRFADIFQDWLVANILDDASVDPRYGYLYPSLPKAVSRTFYNLQVPQTKDTLYPLAARYLTFMAGSQLTVTIVPDAPGIVVRAVETGPSQKRVVEVTPGVPFNESAFGSTYTRIDLAVINTSQSTSVTYAYSAIGSGTASLELKWEQSEPTGYLQNAAGDTVCVQFDGISGAKLDSIRVALRRAGSMTGGVWRYAGDIRPSPFGEKLAVPITASVTSTPSVPYPVPWPNWGVVDLRSFAIDATQPFAVGFVCAGAPTANPRVMVAPVASAGSYHSFTYSTTSSGGPNWYYYTSNSAGDSVWVYLIRAYVSFGPTGVESTRELVPATISLSQNYPNPFNPSTTIGFHVPRASHVRLAITNILGEEVAVLVDGEQAAGDHAARWSAEGMASGPYICRLSVTTAGGGTVLQSRKLLLLR